MKSITFDFPGLSLIEVREQFKEFFYTKQDAWYDSSSFATEKIPAGEWTVSLEPVMDSWNKTWSEQQALLDGVAIVPPAALLVYAICKHFQETGERSFENVYVRTLSLDSDGDHVYVGYFDAKGLRVSHDWDSGRDSVLGLAVAWKGALNPRNLAPSESLILPDILEINGTTYKKV